MARQRHMALCALAVVLCTPALAQGTTVATLATAADAQSQATAVDVARIARDAIKSTNDVEVVALERILEDGAEPAWKKKQTDAEVAVERGTAALSSLELPVAADAFAAALVAYEQAIAGMNSVVPVVEACVKGGTTLVLSGEKAAGQRLFDQALAVDPAYRLPKEGTNARVLKAFEETIKQRRTAGQGTLTVYASTGPAEVWIDGMHRGTAPLSLEMSAGRHYVRVVRDGYLSFGTSIEVRRGSEASVQAALLPTRNLSKLEAMTSKLAREKESTQAAVDAAVALRVDKLVSIVVTDTSGSAALNVLIVDGVSGRELVRATKAFAVGDGFFEAGVRGFITDNYAQALAGKVEAPSPPPANDPVSMLPGDAEAVKTPGTLIAGWVLLGVSVIPIGGAIGFGVASYSYYDGFRNKLPTQTDPNLEPLRNTWLATSIATDVSAVLAVALVATGVILVGVGMAEQAAKEEVLQ